MAKKKNQDDKQKKGKNKQPKSKPTEELMMLAYRAGYKTGWNSLFLQMRMVNLN